MRWVNAGKGITAKTAMVQNRFQSRLMAQAELKLRLHQRGMSVRELAAELGVPLKTVQDWFYRGVSPSLSNQEKLQRFMYGCTHHWVIDAANGHTSRGVCQLCNEVREFENSTTATVWIPPKRNAGAS